MLCNLICHVLVPYPLPGGRHFQASPRMQATEHTSAHTRRKVCAQSYCESLCLASLKACVFGPTWLRPQHDPQAAPPRLLSRHPHPLTCSSVSKSRVDSSIRNSRSYLHNGSNRRNSSYISSDSATGISTISINRSMNQRQQH